MMSAMKRLRLDDETEKNKRYDRQLRLWGDHGQAALERAHICLINATATGTEVLKSLVLPGIGAFTILDKNKVTAEDVGNNFFVDNESIGKSRAKTATDLLLELNSEVHGDFVDEPVENILLGNPNFFEKFTLVIATDLSEKVLLLLANKLWSLKIPLLVCRAYGMIGYMRLQFSEHTIIESHPESEFHDLRLDRPFPELQEFVDSIDLNSLDNKAHSHTPYVVILMKYLNMWKEVNAGKIPQNIKEKNLFKMEIKKGMRKQSDGGEEENFEEALKAVNRAIIETTIPSGVLQLFNDPACVNLTIESSPFWIMIRALKEFSTTKGCLPVSGIIPDMTADTDRYIALQNIYKSEARKDTAAICSLVRELLLMLGKCEDDISEATIKLFCKNTRNLRVLRGTPISEEHNGKMKRLQDLVADLDHDDSDIIYYILLRSVDKFFTEYNRYPGNFTDEVETDIVKLKKCLCHLVQEWGCGPLSRDDYIHEMCRFGAAELHSVASFIGGCAAHEVIKLITRQYVPFNNTFIYNAINSTSAVYIL